MDNELDPVSNLIEDDKLTASATFFSSSILSLYLRLNSFLALAILSRSISAILSLSSLICWISPLSRMLKLMLARYDSLLPNSSWIDEIAASMVDLASFVDDI